MKPQNYITLEEFAAVYPEISYFVRHEFPNKERIAWLRNTCFERYGVDATDNAKIDQFRRNLKVSAIVTYTWVSQEGLATQVFSDLIASRDGRVVGDRRRTEVNPETGEATPIDPQVVEVVFTNDDIVYGDQWPAPRFAPGAFTIFFRSIFKQMYGYEPEIVVLGKPTTVSMRYAERLIEKQAKDRNIAEITQYFMIGDSTFSDIEGAKRRQAEWAAAAHGLDKEAAKNMDVSQKKWVSILVKTGVYNEENGDSTNDADHVVQDLEAAFAVVLKSIGNE